MYLLYDTALNGLYTLNLLQQAYLANVSLFKGTKDEHLFDVAPYLFKIDEFFFEKINDPHAALQAMVMFDSEEKMNDLLEHFKPFIYKDMSGRQHYFRFWDGRVLSRFLQQTTDGERNTFFEAINSFQIPDKDKNIAVEFFMKKGKLQTRQTAMDTLFVLQKEKGNENALNPVAGTEEKKQRSFFK